MNYTTDHTTWMTATDGLRKQMVADAMVDLEAKARKARKGKVSTAAVWNSNQIEKATSQARGIALRAIAELAEYNGTPNPQHSDPVWGPNAAKAEEAAKPIKANRYGGTCTKCSAWVEAEEGKLIKTDAGKWGADHITCPAPKTESLPDEEKDQRFENPGRHGLDLSGLVSGYYAVPDGDTRLKVAINNPTQGKWAGFTFVKDGATYGNFQAKRYGMQKPGGFYKGQIEAQLEAILKDPKAAMIAYGKLVGRCGACGAQLENEASVAAGIGPICEAKW